MEASKCYLQAMKLDSTNFQILRDYSLLQMQMRNYTAYIDAAHQILNSKPTYKAYWMGLVVAYHLSGNHTDALKMLQSFHETVMEEALDTESSEGFLYRNLIIEESLDLEGALKDLLMIENKVLDRSGWQEAKG